MSKRIMLPLLEEMHNELMAYRNDPEVPEGARESWGKFFRWWIDFSSKQVEKIEALDRQINLLHQNLEDKR